MQGESMSHEDYELRSQELCHNQEASEVAQASTRATDDLVRSQQRIGNVVFGPSVEAGAQTQPEVTSTVHISYPFPLQVADVLNIVAEERAVDA